MRAIQVTTLDGPKAVQLVDIPEPDPGSGVLVDVHVAGVNFPDVLMSRGEYQMKPELPFVPGSEVAGTRVDTGQRVAGFSVLGGYAERAVCDPATLFALPDNVSFEAGAALLMNYLTVDFALVRRADLQPGQTVLVHGAAGGIGVATIQLAKVLGARVIACVSTAEKGELAKRAGADEVVLVDGFLAAVKALGGADVVMDPVGGDRFTDSLRSLKPEGKLLVVGFTGGSIPEVKVNRLLLNNISVVGVGWGAWWMTRPGYLQEQWARLLPHLESGALDPMIGNTYPLADAADALLELDERRALAKVLLSTR
ncbi:MAG: Alcohol dehydrogenase zinc-binding domain protein [Frankiales bacterium]|jgi:NADPH2:quinone reductase|nr:Alcohol dehydrogenase zinc-binding domain protein [Frankiales bacterium]